MPLHRLPLASYCTGVTAGLRARLAGWSSIYRGNGRLYRVEEVHLDKEKMAADTHLYTVTEAVASPEHVPNPSGTKLPHSNIQNRKSLML